MRIESHQCDVKEIEMNKSESMKRLWEDPEYRARMLRHLKELRKANRQRKAHVKTPSQEKP